MSAQPPQYNNNEIDLKLQYLEAVNQNRFEQIVGLINKHAEATQNGFKLIDRDITWLKWMLATVVLPLIGAIIAFLFSK